MDQQTRGRQLSRFYEPLVLLHTLGSTRGEHTCAELSTRENVSQLPLKDLRRMFLSELAYTCDYDKGGDTVTAIGLNSTPQNYVFWVASNSCPRRKIVPFLESLLTNLRDISITATLVTLEGVNDIAAQCIRFATPRIKKYRSHLSPLLRKCHAYLAQTEREDGKFSCPVPLCSDSMRKLARLSIEPNYKSNEDAIHNTFGLVRHYIGRLGHHFRAAKALLSCASRLPELLHDFEVRSIPTPPKSASPPADGKTRLESIMVRMLPANSPDLNRYQQALAEMDDKYQLSRRFLDNYTDFSTRVHAEIQVLEQFHVGKLSFAAGDRYIACSKPACFCCLLYFRHHPGHFVEPASHRKIYLNWRPPDLDAECDIISQNRQRDVLNSMTCDIRKEALQQIEEKIPPQAWHPDSLTGVTEEAKTPLPTVGGSVVFDAFPVEIEEPTTITDFGSTLPLFDGADMVNFSIESSDSDHCDKQARLLKNSQPDPYDFEDDSDEEGGVLL
ncbi:uncharacterized protein BDZ99DRAFT_489804 [Mytilinidion resinicola]|uniref:Uncharacterized protein n=1 Tax=Mytilinidion resinicola TaxID=574789 RepID=A0A6A6YG73_9PEZI|nr:uncharacterized protein BDZ99DRAFT_489804 [Mytilinidion resinicola]KAF2807533.1 hypothetical protein BDZ99DRAFT_489804 [Mytilinidion resinicola]